MLFHIQRLQIVFLTDFFINITKKREKKSIVHKIRKQSEYHT
jgi:hypothetical protein